MQIIRSARVVVVLAFVAARRRASYGNPGAQRRGHVPQAEPRREPPARSRRVAQEGEPRRAQAVPDRRRAGTPNPAGGLPQFGGSGATSFSGPDLGEPFASFRARMLKQQPAVDQRGARRRSSRASTSAARATRSCTMSRGKPQPIGPTAPLPKGVKSWEEYAALVARQDPRRRPLPLQAARSSAALDGAHGVPESVDARASRARALRRRHGHPRLLPAGVPAAALSDDAPRARRRHARRRDHLRQLLQHVQRRAHARAARRPAHPGHAVPDDLVQRHAPPRHARAVARA